MKKKKGNDKNVQIVTERSMQIYALVAQMDSSVCLLSRMSQVRVLLGTPFPPDFVVRFSIVWWV